MASGELNQQAVGFKRAGTCNFTASKTQGLQKAPVSFFPHIHKYLG